MKKTTLLFAVLAWAGTTFGQSPNRSPKSNDGMGDSNLKKSEQNLEASPQSPFDLLPDLSKLDSFLNNFQHKLGDIENMFNNDFFNDLPDLKQKFEGMMPLDGQLWSPLDIFGQSFGTPEEIDQMMLKMQQMMQKMLGERPEWEAPESPTTPESAPKAKPRTREI